MIQNYKDNWISSVSANWILLFGCFDALLNQYIIFELHSSVRFDCALKLTDNTLVDLGGRARHAPPLRVQILSFWHAKFLKRSCLGGPRPPVRGPRPPPMEILDPPLQYIQELKFEFIELLHTEFTTSIKSNFLFQVLFYKKDLCIRIQ